MRVGSEERLAADLPGLRSFLDALDSIWRDVGVEYPPGVSDEEIERTCAALSFSPADEVRAWFRWHRPPAPDTNVGASCMCFISLGAAVEEWRFRRRRAEESPEARYYSLAECGWDPMWFPILTDVSGGVVAVDCSVPSGYAAPIRVIHKGDAPEPIDFGSLNELVEGWVALYRSGVYQWRAGAWSRTDGLSTDYPPVIDYSKVPRKMKDVF